MVTFVLKAIMSFGYLVYLGGPADAVLVWSGVNTPPPACLGEAGPCARADADTGTGIGAGALRLAVNAPSIAGKGTSGKGVPVEGQPAELRPAVTDSPEETGRGGPLLENIGSEAKP